MSPRAASASKPSKTESATHSADPTTQAGQVFDAGLLAVFLGLTFLLGVFPLKDTDFWWHLRTGGLIRQTGWVPTADTFTFGAEGHRWVDLHWVFQLLVSWGFERFGVLGLNVAKCVVTVAAVALLVTSGRKSWPIWAALLAWVPAILVLGGRMYLRPETLTLLYLAADLAILSRWDRRPWLAFALPVVQLFWVNTQGLFVFGPFLVALALLDAATRRGAFAAERRGWWRTTLLASAATVLVCLANPYGFRGATYPIELLGTMGNPIFKRSIGELKPVPTLFAEIGFNSLPLLLHLGTMALGALSFVIPSTWRVVTRLQDRASKRLKVADRVEAKPIAKGRKSRKSATLQPPGDSSDDRPLRLFRLGLFLTFSGLSLLATRNSHQFAAVVGTVTAWNFSEWASEIAPRLRRRRGASEATTAPRVWPKLVTLGVLAAAIVAVGSGKFYAWCQEGRTIGLGEEPLWFAHDAIKFAGSPGMPDRLVGYHNGHPSLFEYYWGPGKKVYTDARLEVMGPKLYEEYLDLQRKIARDKLWSGELDKMGRPSVLVDTVDPSNGDLVATLLNSLHWRCVWFDPIAAVFVHDSYQAIVKAHEVDFLARHYGREAEAAKDDPAALLAMSRSLRGVAIPLRSRPGGELEARHLIWLGLDYARRLRGLDPTGLDGFKQAGLLNFLRDPILSEQPIPRYRFPFDPTIDLPLVTASYQLDKALTIDPEDGTCLYYLANLDATRGMDESALPLMERFTLQPDKNLSQQEAKVRVIEQVAEVRRRLGPELDTKWANLSELEQVFDRLVRSGRPATAADVVELGHRDDARPWPWADRLATIRLHLGQPARAREIWRSATAAPSPALQSTRVGMTYLVEGNLDAARKQFAEAVGRDPGLFEAHFGLATLEQGAGRADAAVASARLAEQSAPNDRCRKLAGQIIAEASPYLRRFSVDRDRRPAISASDRPPSR